MYEKNIYIFQSSNLFNLVFFLKIRELYFCFFFHFFFEHFLAMVCAIQNQKFIDEIRNLGDNFSIFF